MMNAKLIPLLILGLAAIAASAEIRIQPDGILRIGSGELLVRHYHPQWRTSVPRQKGNGMPSSGGSLKTPWKLFDGTDAQWGEEIRKESDGTLRVQYTFRSERPARTAILAAELTLPVKEFQNASVTADGKEIVLNTGKTAFFCPGQKSVRSRFLFPTALSGSIFRAPFFWRFWIRDTGTRIFSVCGSTFPPMPGI